MCIRDSPRGPNGKISTNSVIHDWFFSYISSSAIYVQNSVGVSAGTSVGSLTISLNETYCISHPDNMGYAGCYWGGLKCQMGFMFNYPVTVTSECQRTLGPVWLPHSTFYPLVECYRSNTTVGTSLTLKGGEIENLRSTPGYGMVPRPQGNQYPEYVCIPSDLVYLPLRKLDRSNFVMYPTPPRSYVNYDNCIYPVVDDWDESEMDIFYHRWIKDTKINSFSS